ncbi:MAG: hypothetical protein WCH34_17755 [Bacteroidota bacterium]|jgi:hypothetical protein
MKTNKDFDCVKMMRDIRDKIDAELEGKNTQQVLDYFRKNSQKFEKKYKKPVANTQ